MVKKILQVRYSYLWKKNQKKIVPHSSKVSLLGAFPPTPSFKPFDLIILSKNTGLAQHGIQ